MQPAYCDSAGPLQKGASIILTGDGLPLSSCFLNNLRAQRLQTLEKTRFRDVLRYGNLTLTVNQEPPAFLVRIQAVPPVHAGLTQWPECQPSKLFVIGSNPIIRSTFHGVPRFTACIAQLVEHRLDKAVLLGGSKTPARKMFWCHTEVI